MLDLSEPSRANHFLLFPNPKFSLPTRHVYLPWRPVRLGVIPSSLSLYLAPSRRCTLNGPREDRDVAQSTVAVTLARDVLHCPRFRRHRSNDKLFPRGLGRERRSRHTYSVQCLPDPVIRPAATRSLYISCSLQHQSRSDHRRLGLQWCRLCLVRGLFLLEKFERPSKQQRNVDLSGAGIQSRRSRPHPLQARQDHGCDYQGRTIVSNREQISRLYRRRLVFQRIAPECPLYVRWAQDVALRRRHAAIRNRI